MDGSEIQNDKASLQISDAIERLLANPELLSTVASAIGISKPEVSSESASEIQKTSENEPISTHESTSQKAQSATQKLPEAITALSPMLTALTSIKKTPDDDLSRLLFALKPYVSGHRREAIDTMVQISKLSEVFKNVK